MRRHSNASRKLSEAAQEELQVSRSAQGAQTAYVNMWSMRDESEEFMLDSRNTFPLTALQDTDISRSVGLPRAKRQLTGKQSTVAVACLIAFAASLVTVFDSSVAIGLGQAYQLIVIGFLLSIMGICLSTEARSFLIAYEAGSSNVLLQNLEGISQLQFTGDHVQLGHRIVIFLVLALPVALSVAYKTFQGGFTQGSTHSSTADFGTVGPPGTLGIGWGLSLFINATLPWFGNPGFNQTYGFNTYVQSENVTAMLDGPLPAQVTQIQSQLRQDEKINISADVMAIVGSLDPSLEDSPENLEARWELGRNATSKPWATGDFVWYSTYRLGLMTVSATNASKWWVSWYSTNATTEPAQSFGSEVRQYSIFQQQYHGIWTITPGSVALISASPIPNTIVSHPSIIEDQDATINELYHTPYTEFDYHFLQYAYGNPPNQTKITEFIKTDATLLSSMVWSRLAALDGPFTDYEDFHKQTQYSAQTIQQKSRTTLKRTAALIVVLAINPVFVLSSIIYRTAFLYQSPVTDNFGIISLLAAAHDSNSEVLRGAALSGKLKRPLPLRFAMDMQQDPVGMESANQPRSLKVIFDSRGKGVRLEKKMRYS